MSKTYILDKTKDEDREVLCNRCDLQTNHTVCNSVRLLWGNDDIQGCDDYEIIRCLGCDQVSFRVCSTNSEDYLRDEEGRYESIETEDLYPNRLEGRTPLREQYSLPEKIRVIYKETHTALSSKLKILAGIGTRALIEAVCLQENAKGRTLENKIDHLVISGVLTKSNSEILHKTRFLGNRSAHEIEAAKDQELEIAFDIIENLLKTIYIIPHKARGL